MEAERFGSGKPNDRIAQSQARNIPVFYNIGIPDLLRDASALNGGHEHFFFSVLPKKFFDVPDRSGIVAAEENSSQKTGEQAVRTRLAVDIHDLLDVLISDQEFDAKAAAKVDGIIHMTQIGQKLPMNISRTACCISDKTPCVCAEESSAM